MKIIDERAMTATEEFGELPIGTVFEYPIESGMADYYGVCMKIASADCDDNAIDLQDCTVFSVPHKESVCVLNAHLVIEGKE